jgi:NAD(P)-dependent dehydrogenase (short-subunit alcohol dehydrogenase family)
MSSPIEYSASKAGIIAITTYLAKYIKNKNLRINCVSPGGIFDNQKKEFIRRYKKDCISKGLLDPKDLCETINFLISKESFYIRGQNIIIDDGWSL